MSTVDRINARAGQVDWRRVLLVALMVLPYVIGWLCRKTVLVLAWSTAWVWAAAVEGWTSAGPQPAEDRQPWDIR